MSTLVIDIRPARASDAAAIAEAHDEAWRYAYRGIIPGRELERMIQRRGANWWESAITRGSRILVLATGGDVAGYASYGKNRAGILPVKGEIYELYVRPHFQGIGLGRKLFQSCRTELTTRGVDGLAVWALTDNETACDFYRAVGGTASARGSESFGGVTLDKLAFTWP
jgi:ribosomal protein S18 acetylase RimI-like enzyme